MRYNEIMSFLNEINYDVKKLSAVVGRGGLLPPVKSGAYRVNDVMVDVLKNRPVVDHASNLGGIISYEMAEKLGIPSFIYDSVAVDELKDIARYSGMADIKRKSLSHALNMRAVAIKTAEEMDKEYMESNIIVAHLGGGMSISIHEKGKMVDIVSDDEGPFSPERSGRVPCLSLINMCYENDHKTMRSKLRGKGGLTSYLGTNDAREVEKMIADGSEEAAMVYEAMAYQIAKGIGELATVVKGKVDAIAITGGIAYSKMMTNWIQERVEFIAPVHLHPGENELESLVLGTIRVLDDKEEAREYKEKGEV
jgi:butyrate kinase